MQETKHITIVGRLPLSARRHRYILTAQCSVTKWLEVYVIPNQRATNLTRVLVRNLISQYGVPESIDSDQVFEETCSCYR